jgi:PAB1-binding protein PBP1
MPLNLAEKQVSRQRRGPVFEKGASSSISKLVSAQGTGDAAAKGLRSPAKRDSGTSPPDACGSANRILFIFACLLGREVEVLIRDGSCYRGVLYTAVPEEGIVLRFAERIVAGASAPSKFILSDPPKVVPFLVIRRGDLLSLRAREVSFQSTCGPRERASGVVVRGARSTTVATDLEISSAVGKGGPRERDLIAWSDYGEASDASAFSQRTAGELGSRVDEEAPLESLDRYPRTKWDQFAENERKFGVQTTYKEEHYTTRLDASRFTEADVARAAKIASEIESKTADNPHVAEERGQLAASVDGHDDDGEERRYSSVLRSEEFPTAPGKFDTNATRAALTTGNRWSENSEAPSSITAGNLLSCTSNPNSAALTVGGEPVRAPSRNSSSASLSRNSSSEFLRDRYDVEHKRVLQRLSSRQRLDEGRAAASTHTASGSTSPALGAGSERASPAAATTPTGITTGISSAGVALGREVASLNLELSVPQVHDEVARKLSEFKAQHHQQGYESERSRERETDSFRRFSAEIERKTSSSNLRSMTRAASGTSLAGTENSFAVEGRGEECEREAVQPQNSPEKEGSQPTSSPSRKTLDPNAKEFHLNAAANAFIPTQDTTDTVPFLQSRFRGVSPGNSQRIRNERHRPRDMVAMPREQTVALSSGGAYYNSVMNAVYPPMQPYPSPYLFPYGPQPMMPTGGFVPMPPQFVPNYMQMPQGAVPFYPNQFASPIDYGTVPQPVMTPGAVQGSDTPNDGSYGESLAMTRNAETRVLNERTKSQKDAGVP